MSFERARVEPQMAFDVSDALIGVLFLAPLPMACLRLRRTRRTALRGGCSEVALKAVGPPADPARFANRAFAIGGLAGRVVVPDIAWTRA